MTKLQLHTFFLCMLLMQVFPSERWLPNVFLLMTIAMALASPLYRIVRNNVKIRVRIE